MGSQAREEDGSWLYHLGSRSHLTRGGQAPRRWPWRPTRRCWRRTRSGKSPSPARRSRFGNRPKRSRAAVTTPSTAACLNFLRAVAVSIAIGFQSLFQGPAALRIPHATRQPQRTVRLRASWDLTSSRCSRRQNPRAHPHDSRRLARVLGGASCAVCPRVSLGSGTVGHTADDRSKASSPMAVRPWESHCPSVAGRFPAARTA